MLDRRMLPVPPPLRPWVADISATSITRGSHTVVEPPDPATTLTVRSDGRGRRDALVMGPRTRARYTLGGPGPSCLQLRLHPGATPPVGQLRAVVDGVASLPDGHLAQALARIAVDARLAHEAHEAHEPRSAHVPDEAALAHDAHDAAFDTAATRTLAQALAASPGAADLVQEATRLLPDQPVHIVARKLGLSERQLRTLFARMLGLSPKQVARLHRVRTVLAGAHHGDLAGLAVRAGYYDQAHMTTEFRRIVGVPPGAYAAGRRPAPSPCGHL